jgi:hypothetical protein
MAAMIAIETHRIHALFPGARPASTRTTSPVSSTTAGAGGVRRWEKRPKNSSAIFAAAPSMSREPICAILPPTCALTS